MSAPNEPGVRARPRPVLRFLGEDEATGGPFALLGISPTACTDDLVLSALDRQVERIDRHPECDTPEADEVRLALHAAAAQLLDPVVRRHLIAKWTGTSVAPARPAARGTAPAASAAAPPTRSAAPSAKLLEADAILTLGLFGGWNQRSLRRLLSLAHARGLSNTQVAETLRNLSRRRRRAPRPPAPRPVMRRARTREEFLALDTPGLASRSREGTPSAGPSVVERPHSAAIGLPEADQRDPAQALLRNALVLGGIGLVAMAGMFALILLMTGGPSPTAPTPPITAAPAAIGSTGAPPPVAAVLPDPGTQRAAATPERIPLNLSDLAALTRELAACAQAVQTEPAEATMRFEVAVQKLAAGWDHVPPDRLIACHDAIVEFIYKSAAQPEANLRALAAIGEGAGALPAPMQARSVLPSVWSAGMLVRLGRERDLSAAAKTAIDSRISEGLGPARPALEQSFEAGAGAALSIIPHRLTPGRADAAADVEAWTCWADGVDALGRSDATQRLRLLLSGLEVLLTSGPEPNVNRSVAETVGLLTLRITWRQQDESRRWLLRWFCDPRFSAADLHAVTSALAAKSSAEGVDLTMVLSTAASDSSRADLRDRYATVWSLAESVSRDDLTTAWVKEARDAINDSFTTGGASGEVDALSRAAVLARLSEAAWWQWRGDGGEAARIVADLRPPVEAAMASFRTDPTSVKLELSDGAWAEKYLAARQNIKVRRDLLEQLGAATSGLGPADAEVLAGEALAGSPSEVRAQAFDVLKRYTDHPAVINAVLERLPRAPRLPGTTNVIEFLCQRQLPPIKDPEWPVAARRMLVERLLEAIAAEGPMARVDRLATIISVSYRSMAAPAPLAADQRALPVQPAAHLSASGLWLRWRAAAETAVPTTPPPLPLDQIDRRRAGRLSQARGMVQAFAAEQVSIAEVMAYVVHAEHPEKAEQIQLLMTDLAEHRRRAEGILEQLNAAERAIVQLWLVRFKEDPAA